MADLVKHRLSDRERPLWDRVRLSEGVGLTPEEHRAHRAAAEAALPDAADAHRAGFRLAMAPGIPFYGDDFTVQLTPLVNGEPDPCERCG